MQSIDQQAAYIYIQAAASQTSGQPLSRNCRVQTPNSCWLAAAAGWLLLLAVGQLDIAAVNLASTYRWTYDLIQLYMI